MTILTQMFYLESCDSSRLRFRLVHDGLLTGAPYPRTIRRLCSVDNRDGQAQVVSVFGDDSLAAAATVG
jgi:hypothetical protein